MKRGPQPVTPRAEQVQGIPDVVPQTVDLVTIPAVCFIEDVCRALRVSRRTVERLRRFGAFPIPEMPALDKRPRWSGTAVSAFLEQRKRGTRQLVAVR